jgi:signal transduction histidine kinase/DNA-binding response OmpR family regulator
MATTTVPGTSKSASELESFFRSMQVQTLNMISVLLGAACVLLYSSGFQNQGQSWYLYLATGLLVIGLVAWLIRGRSFGLASALIVLGCLAAIYTGVYVGAIQTAAVLLVLPAGLATLTLDIWGGGLTAALTSLALLKLPPALLPLPDDLRWACTLEVWVTVGMIWLALRPLLRSVEWTWEAYDESQILLKQAREAQSRLQQALEDAAAANQQLFRLNKLAQDLRQIAENERQAKQQFVANVSHELRTPLNMIIGFCEVILKKPQTYGKRALPPVLLADLEVVLRNSQHLSELIDDVLDLSQIDAGKMALFKERVSLAEIIDAAVIAIRPLYVSKGLSLETELTVDLPNIYCDRTRIREVLLNLLSNAGRFTSQGGVKIKVQREDSTVTVLVTDTGAGMPPEVTGKLFQPFQQADSSIRQRYGGTGLGLAISKNFVELHDGKMWVQSQPGVGTTFFFQLPIDPPIPLKSGPLRWLNQWPVLKERSHAPRPLSGEVKPRLVVVEQGDVMQKLFNRYLQGYEIVSEPILDKALADLAHTPAQALLVNTLPVEDGLARLTEPSALPYSIPAMVCSIPGIEQASAALGAGNYLVKPISQETLLAALAHVGRPVHTILLVDDEPDAIQLFRRMLLSAERDYRVLRAENGRHALEVLRQETVDVILLDLTMPEMDGFQFLAVKKQSPELSAIPVILISARDPSGQPIASNAIAVTRGGGFSAAQIMDCIEAFMTILSPEGRPEAGPGSAESSPG